MYYIQESPCKDRSTRVCVCVGVYPPNPLSLCSTPNSCGKAVPYVRPALRTDLTPFAAPLLVWEPRTSIHVFEAALAHAHSCSHVCVCVCGESETTSFTVLLLVSTSAHLCRKCASRTSKMRNECEIICSSMRLRL